MQASNMVPSQATCRLMCSGLGITRNRAMVLPLLLFASVCSPQTALQTDAGQPYTGPIMLESFRYIPPARAAEPAQTQRKPDEQRIVDLHAAGEYGQAGTEGLALLQREKPDEALQLIMANSLAWTGRTKDATAIYQGITEPEFVDDANVGIANILRWQGREHLAAPIFREILGRRPDHADAQTGLRLAERELVPRTSISFGGLRDSGDFARNAAIVNHRWRGDGGYTITEVELGAVRDTLPNVETRQRDVTLRYQDLAMELKPALELSLPQGDGSDKSRLYGNLKLMFDQEQIRVTMGRVNWGRMVNNANALRQGIAATQLGANVRRELNVGELQGRLDYYNVSDGNSVWTGDLRLNGNMRPLGSKIRPYVGIEGRKARFNTPNYWSPVDGHGTAYVGLNGDWGADDWTLFATGQIGAPIYGEAGKSWSVAAGAKRWITDDLALSFNLWSMASVRAGTAYRAQSANMQLEKLWR